MAFSLLPYSLFEEVLWSLTVVSKQRKEVPGHVKLQLCSTTLIEMVVQYKLCERSGKRRPLRSDSLTLTVTEASSECWRKL